MIKIRHIPVINSLTIICLATSALAAFGQELKGPIVEGQKMQGQTANQDAIGGLGAPGAEAIMTEDMLLVNPSQKSGQTPISGYIGMALKMDVNRVEVKYKDLRGLTISVVNDTNRPLVIDADSAIATIGGKSVKSAPLTALQLAVNPQHGLGGAVVDLTTKVAPAAATISALPTIEDFYKYSKPPINRYGKDQERRALEGGRFGKRILWPHEKTQGVVYFETKQPLGQATIQIPVATLFDKQDHGILVSSPNADCPD